MDLEVTTLAYFAGVMDGEGCISIRRSHLKGGLSTRYAVSVTVGNTSRELIARLMETFGVGNVTYRYPTRQNKGCYLWTLSSGGARLVLNALLPYLAVKQPQASIVLEFIRGFRSYKGAGPGHFGGTRVAAEELARRAELFARVTELNRVGPVGIVVARGNGKKSKGITAEFRTHRSSELFDSDALDAITGPDLVDDVGT